MRILRSKRVVVVSFLAVAVVALGLGSAALGVCGPFTDTAADAFCPLILQVFYLGITTGTTPSTYDPAGAVNRTQLAAVLSRTVDGTLKTTPTTYDPASDVSRPQMAAFLSRAVDGILRRGSRRAAVGRYWLPASADAIGLATVGGSNPSFVKSDGADVWATSFFSLSRVRASDGKLLATWTSATQIAQPMVLAFGRHEPERRRRLPLEGGGPFAARIRLDRGRVESLRSVQRRRPVLDRPERQESHRAVLSLRVGPVETDYD